MNIRRVKDVLAVRRGAKHCTIPLPAMPKEVFTVMTITVKHHRRHEDSLSLSTVNGVIDRILRQ